MARRENQGLQIAVILLVLFSVLMTGLTYMFWSGKQQVTEDLAAANAAKNTADTEVRAMSLENQELKSMMGAAPDAPLDTVQQSFARDMQLFASTITEENRNYPYLPKFLMSEIRQRDENLKEERQRLSQLKAEMEEVKNTAQAKITEVEQNRTELFNRVQTLTTEFEQRRQEFLQQTDRLTQELDAAREQYNQELTKIKADNDRLAKDLQLAEATIRGLRERIAQLDQKTMDHPDGEVTWVNQKSNYVYVNLGLADGLQRLTQFNVYGADAYNIAESKPKGTVEIVRVLGPHRAEALITDDDHTNPIMRGDLIFTPLWQAGNPMRFALAGFMDLDGDGVTDRDMVKNIITLNGGVIDAEVTDEGTREGDLTLQTSYLVVGEPPSASRPEIAAEYTRITNEASEMGIKSLSVEKLISNLNYRGSARKTKPNHPSTRARDVTREQGDTTSHFRRRSPPELPRSSF